MDQGPSIQQENDSIANTGVPTIVNKINDIANKDQPSTDDLVNKALHTFDKSGGCDPDWNICNGAKMVATAGTVMVLVGSIISCV